MAKLQLTRKLAIVGLLASSAACSHALSTIGPSATNDAHVLAISGQSNALYERPFLASAYGPTVVGAAQGSTAISAWDVDGPLWQQLQATVQRPLDAFVWWQGESDLTDLDTYAARLDDLLGRVRAASGQGRLRIVICGANAFPENAPLIAVQRHYAATRPNAVFVPSDDLPMLGVSQHLTDDGYRTMAERIIAAIP